MTGNMIDHRNGYSASSETDDQNKNKKFYKNSDESFDEIGSSAQSEKSIIINPKKRLYSESHSDISSSTLIPKAYKRLSNLKNTSVQWLDTIPNGKLFIQYVIDYEEIPAVVVLGSNSTNLRSIYKN